MEYLCILNAFEKNYYSRMKEIETATSSTAQSKPSHHSTKASTKSSSTCLASENISNSRNTTTNNHINHSTLITSPSSSSSGSASFTSSPVSSTNSSQIATNGNVSSKAKERVGLQLGRSPDMLTPMTGSSNNENIAATASVAAAATAMLVKNIAASSKLKDKGMHQYSQKSAFSNFHSNDAAVAAAAAAALHFQQHQQQLVESSFHCSNYHQYQKYQQHPHFKQHSSLQHLPLHQQLQQNNSHVANSLLWQPWRDFQQAAVVQHHLFQQQQLQKETRLSSKELPTAKWRRDRRLRTGEYHGNITSAAATSSSLTSSPPGQPHHLGVLSHHHQAPHHPHQLSSPPAHMSMVMTANSIRPLCDDYDSHIAMESPLDMSVSSTSLKQRASPPPPYREPLPGSTYANSLARPSVITQAPPKRYSHDSNIHIANRETDNCSTESISMCETVIEEHFRRSLGPNYVALFGKKSPAQTTTPSPQPRSITSSPPSSISASSATGQVMLIAQPTPQIPPPAYQLSPQTLVSPKVSNSSSAPATPLMLIKSAPSSPQIQNIVSLPPPQEQPLALQRTPPALSASSSPQPQIQQQIQNFHEQQLSPHHLSTQLTITTSQPSTANSTPLPSPPGNPSSPRPISNGTNIYSSLPSPNQPQNLHQQYHHHLVNHSQQQSHLQQQQNASSKIIRIKNEPGLQSNSNSNMTNHSSPPSSPMSSSNASGSFAINSASDTIPSVDDHFAKALGDNWKNLLQESKK